MNYLAIDYGLAHLGLATAATGLAEPLRTIPTDQAIPAILDLIDSHSIGHIIIGLPEGKIADNVHAFARQLKDSTSLPISLHDETLTSYEAKQKLQHAKKSKRGVDHHFAAALILQDYLDFSK